MEPRMVLSRLLELSRKAGARGTEALFEHRSTISLGWVPRGEPRLTAVERLSVQLVVYMAEGRHAALRLEAPRSEGILDQVEAQLPGLLERAAESDADPLASPADRLDIGERGLGLADRRHAQLDLDDRRDVIRENVAGCMGVHPDIVIARAAYDEHVLQRAFANSRGVSGVEHSTRFCAHIDASIGRDGRIHRQQVASRQFASIASMPFGVDLGERLHRLTLPAELPGTPLPVLLEARPMAHILRSLALACVARDVDSGASFLASLPDRRLGSPRLHVIDDPTIPGGLRTRAFDDRGVAPAPVVIVREGTVAGLYLDPETARGADLRPTGHCTGGQLQPSNIIMRPGSRTRNAIGMDIEDYLTIDEIHAATPVDVATGMLDTTCDLMLYRGHGLVGSIQGQSLRLPVATFLGGICEIASDQLRVEEVDASPVVLEPLDFTK